MADLSRIADEIRGFLLSYDQGMKPGLIELSRNYAEMCAEANKRLAKCQRLLQQGLRAEAIHLSKEPPDLLDSVQVLDFAERGAWLDIVRRYDLVVPPELDAPAVEFLHSAYIEENPLRHLLKTHRRLALQRAPLSRRLQVLRELAENDPNSPVWPADIQIFENARIDQIQREAVEAKRQKDLATLALLKEELSSKDWTTPPPKPLARDVAQTLAHLRTVQKRQDQVGLINDLHDAFAALDVDKGREIRTRWRLMDGDGDPSANPLYSQVEPVFLWLAERDREDEEENRYHQALAELTHSIEMATTRDELESSHELLVQAGRGVPDDLGRKYRDRIDQFSRQSARKLRLIAVAVVLLLAASLVVAALVFKNRAEEARSQEFAEQLDACLQGNRIDEARALRDRLSGENPGVLQHPAVAAEVAKLDEKLAEEARRVQEFNMSLKVADEAPVAEDEPKELLEAEKRAANPSERDQVEALRKRRQKEYRARLDKADVEVGRGLKDVEVTIKNLEARFDQDDKSEEQVRSELGQVGIALANMKTQVDQAGKETRQEYAADLKNSERLREKLQRRKEEKDVEAEIPRAFQEPGQIAEEYVKVLKASIEKISGSRRSEDFKRVLAEQPIWAGALAWSRFVYESRRAFLQEEDPADSERKAVRCKQLLDAYPQMPDRRTVEQVRDHFQAIAQRTLGDDNLKKKIVDLLENPIIANVYMTTVRDYKGTRYYFSKAPYDKSTGKLMVIEGTGNKKIEKPFGGESDVSPSDPEHPQLSPQSILAKILISKLNSQGNLHGWDAMMPDFMTQVAEASSENVAMNPILKYMMISRIRSIAAEGSRPLALGLAKLSGALEEVRGEIKENLPWLNPEDRESERSREKAREFLNKYKLIAPEIKAATDAARKALEFDYSQTPQLYGWLIRDQESRWECRPIPGLIPPASGDLLVVEGTSQGEWHSVGFLRNSKCNLPNLSNVHLVQGRLVFVRPKADSGDR